MIHSRPHQPPVEPLLLALTAHVVAKVVKQEVVDSCKVLVSWVRQTGGGGGGGGGGERGRGPYLSGSDVLQPYPYG